MKRCFFSALCKVCIFLLVLAFIHGFDIATLIPEIEEEPAHVVGAPVEPALPRRISLPQEALMRCRSAL